MKEWTEATEAMNKHRVFLFPDGEGTVVMLPHSLLQEAEMDKDCPLQIICEEGRIIIEMDDILTHLPEDLLEFYDVLGFSREKVRAIFEKMAAEAGGFDKLVEGAKAGKLNIATGRIGE